VTESPAILRRRRGKRVMDTLTVVCVAVVMGVGTSQVASEGWQEFLDRPPGVGATPSEPQAAAPVTGWLSNPDGQEAPTAVTTRLSQATKQATS
jgi:hypothetical protein